MSKKISNKIKRIKTVSKYRPAFFLNFYNGPKGRISSSRIKILGISFIRFNIIKRK